jgi:cell division protease FtsH
VVLLGGRVAEHAVFGQVTTGAADDLTTTDYSMSDHTRRMVDEEQQYLTDLAYRRATAMVARNRALLDALAATLLDKEVLERADIERLVAQHGGGRESGRPATETHGALGRPRLAASESLEARGP